MRLKTEILKELNFIGDRVSSLCEMIGRYTGDDDDRAILMLYTLVKADMGNILKQMEKMEKLIKDKHVRTLNRFFDVEGELAQLGVPPVNQ